MIEAARVGITACPPYLTSSEKPLAQKNESPFVGRLEKIISDCLLEFSSLQLQLKRGELLDYQSGFETRSKFETDLCIFEGGKPRVVFELKTAPTTHDVMVYSQKADDHKREYPYLVYGMIAERGNAVATKLLKHNRHMDFAMYLGELSEDEIAKTMTDWIGKFVDESLLRERIATGEKVNARSYFRKTVCQ